MNSWLLRLEPAARSKLWILNRCSTSVTEATTIGWTHIYVRGSTPSMQRIERLLALLRMTQSGFRHESLTEAG